MYDSYTYYELDVFSGDKSIYTILSELDRDEFEDLFCKINDDGSPNDNDTYWDCEEDMKAISEMYPDIVFQLTGQGQIPDDMWRQYFKNGKSHKVDAIVTYPPFDEDKLEKI